MKQKYALELNWENVNDLAQSNQHLTDLTTIETQNKSMRVKMVN